MNDNLTNFLKIAFIGSSFFGMYHHFCKNSPRNNPLLSLDDLEKAQKQREIFGGVLGAVRRKRQYVRRKQAAHNLLVGIKGGHDFDKIKRTKFSKTDIKNLGPVRQAPIIIGNQVFYQTFRV